MLREVNADIKMFIEELKQLQSKGFKYVARDPGMHSVTCYAAKPKKYYMDNEDFFWGYHDKDLPEAKPAHPILFDAPGIYANSKQATLIEDWLKVYGVT